MRSFLSFYCYWLLLCVAVAAAAQGPEMVATIPFEVGSATLAAEQTARLDDLKQKYPPADYVYSFEGDHDPEPFADVSLNVSERLNERLAESRWQSVAAYLAVPAIGLARSTGKIEARVYVQKKPAVAPPMAAVPEAWRDSLDALRRRIDAQDKLITDLARQRAAPETTFAVARLEQLYVRLDKWVEEKWWESQGGFEVGLLRTEPPGKRPGGATLVLSDGTSAYHAFEITTRLDCLRLGVPRIGITPAFRWYDWSLHFNYGNSKSSNQSLATGANPVYLLGLDLDAVPWSGSRVRLTYAGAGAAVHAVERHLSSYDQYDLHIDQRLAGNWYLALQGVYDERFEKSLCYAGGWLAYGWPLRVGTLSLSLGFVNQLDAFAAGKGIEDQVPTISFEVGWLREKRFRF